MWGADDTVCGATHLTFPGPTGQARGLAAYVAPRPLLSPLKGGDGLFSRKQSGRRRHFRLNRVAMWLPTSILRTALRIADEGLGEVRLAAPLPQSGRGCRAQRGGWGALDGCYRGAAQIMPNDSPEPGTRRNPIRS